jgi:2,4-dienoyl-CoA reductase-like NADH-dependent reductase (Old Yellow Enzyme family)
MNQEQNTHPASTSPKSKLFSPVTIRGLQFRNRIVISPMCQYSAEGGCANDWHQVHLGALATGGAGAVLSEAAAVLPEGRISPQDLGLWSEDQEEMLGRIFHFVKGQGAIAGIQLAHAGRKASTSAPWNGGSYLPEASGGWVPVAPSPLPFHEGDPLPRVLTVEGILRVVGAFQEAASRAYRAGCQLVEIHAAHGYLLHQFLSPLTNQRKDSFGGSFENRTRLVREVIAAVRQAWPEKYPLFLRISATDWVEGGWHVEDSIALARQVGPLGVDLVDCSSGGIVPSATIPAAPGFQAAFAGRVKREAGIRTGAVGLITTGKQAEEILQKEEADLIFVGRAALRNPHWPIEAALELGETAPIPKQYQRAY